MDIARTFFRFAFPLVAFFVTSALFMINHALADIYKCPQPDGLVNFSDKVCADGKAEPLVLLENSPLDNTAERENIARYKQQQILDSRRKPARQMPQMVLIEDTPTVERNARIMAQEHPKKKRKGKKKKRKQAAAKNKQAAANTKKAVGEITH